MKEKVKAFMEEHKVGFAIGGTLVGIGIIGKIFYKSGLKHGSNMTAIMLDAHMPEANIIQKYFEICTKK